MGELACDGVRDRDQMPGGALAACLGLRGLDEPVGRLDTPVGEPGIEGIEDAPPMVLEGLGGTFDGLKAATPGPAVPALEQWLGLFSALGHIVPTFHKGLNKPAAQVAA